jgi:hypothetical protein
MAEEIWRDIPGYEAEYQASSHGRIRSKPRMGRILKRLYGGVVLAQNTCGVRALVTLCKDSVVTTKTVHKLVCLAFHGPRPSSDHVVAHWDGDGWNNRADNLRWATYAENEADKRRHGTDAGGERNPSVKLTAEQVAEIRSSTDRARGYCGRLAEQYGVSRTQISAILTGRAWNEGGNSVRRERKAARELAARSLIEDSGERGEAMGGKRAIRWRAA